MGTYVYMIRHAESIYVHGNERLRGLSDKGREDARKVEAVLRDEAIDVFVSSSYMRAIETMRALAESHGKDITEYEELRERPIAGPEIIMDESLLFTAIEKSFADKDYKMEGGESTREAQVRAIPIFKQLLVEHAGKKIAIGTHGNIMTIIMNYFDESYGYDFWKSTSKPDIYRLEFDGLSLKSVERHWS